MDKKERKRIINKGSRRLGALFIILFVEVLTIQRMEFYPGDNYYTYVNALLIVYGIIELLEFLGYVVELINLSKK